MNLLFDAWIPVTTASGRHFKLAPTDLTAGDDPPVDISAVRHDFDGALAQFLVGVFQSFLPPRGDREWEKRFRLAPSRDELIEALMPHRDAFELFHPERPFMQDTSLAGDLSNADAIASLLIEAPGGNTQKENKDIFVKRGRVAALAPGIAAQALLGLQINAPGGGVGYRTGLRGGGPLSTLIWPQRQGSDARVATLWEKIWLNVLKVDWEEGDIDWSIALPWLRPVRASRKGDRDEQITQGSLKHGTGPDPLCYWASPRRLRLLRGHVPARCDLSGDIVERPVVGVLAENYGPNYLSERFEHPLSPYYRQKADTASWLPLHPRGGGLGFRDWPTFCGASGNGEVSRKAAANVRDLARESRRYALRSLQVRRESLWVFGYQMDNAKVLTWQESRMPLFPDCDDVARLASFANDLVSAAESARSLLRGALKEVVGEADGSLPDAAERTLFDRAEPAFYTALSKVSQVVSTSGAADRAEREHWASVIRHELLGVFDTYADSASVKADTGLRHVKRVAVARGRMLGVWQSEYRKLLNLPLPDGEAAVPSRKSRSGT